MSDEDNRNREHDIGERILSFLESDGQNRRKWVTEEEARSLKAAAGRLDQLLVNIAAEEQARSKQLKEEDVRALSAAADKLDQMLTRTPKRELTESAPQPRRRKNSME